MLFCKNCGKQLPEGAKFCEHCGAPQMMMPGGQSDRENQQGSLNSSSGEKKKQGYLDESYHSHAEQHTLGQEGTQTLNSPHMATDGSSKVGEPGMQDAAFEAAFQETVNIKDSKKKSKPVGAIIAGIVVAVLAAAFFLMPSGWSTEDAEEATQAYLDYYFKGDTENFAKVDQNVTEEELAAQNEKWREESIATQFKSGVPVTDELKARYADFYIGLEKKSHYTVGDAKKTDDGFEVPVSVEPIVSLVNGEFVLLDLQLNDEISDAELNERFYTHELEIMEKLAETPVYGDPKEYTMHITKGDDGEYAFSEDDLNRIHDSIYLWDRHWTKEKAKKVVETILGAIYNEKYAELAEISFATEDEICDYFDMVFSPERLKETMDERIEEELRENEIDESYSMSEELAKGLSKSERDLLHGTEYKVLGIEGDEEEYTAKISLTPLSLDKVDKAIEEGIQKEADSISSFGQYMDRYYEMYIEETEKLTNEKEFAEPVERELHLRFNNNNAYEADIDEMVSLLEIYVENPQESSDSGQDSGEDNEESEESSDTGNSEVEDASEAGSNADGEDIPVYVGDLKIDFQKTTLQEILDETGMELQSDDQGKTVNKKSLDHVYLDAGSDIDFMINLDNFDSEETRHAEECEVYGLEYMDYFAEAGKRKDILSVGDICTGDTLEKVKKTFGKPSEEGKGYVDYSLGHYWITFMYDEEDTVWAIDIEMEDL